MSQNAIKALKKYPRFYMLKVTFGYGLFAHDGENSGSGMGHFYHDSGDLVLYGAKNFRKRAGLAYSRKREHERFKATFAEMKAAAVWIDRV